MEPGCVFLKKINKIDKHLTRVVMKKKRETPNK